MKVDRQIEITEWMIAGKRDETKLFSMIVQHWSWNGMGEIQ